MKNWMIGLVIAILVVAGIYYFGFYRPAATATPESTPVAVAEPEVEPEAAAPQPEPEATQLQPAEPAVLEPVPLPMLAESDPVALDSLADLVGAPAVQAYLASDNVVSRLVTTVDALSGRQVPGAIQAVQPPDGDFLALPNPEPEEVIRNEAGDIIPQFTLNPDNYARYTPYVELLESADPAALVDSYHRNYELLQEAYRLQGFPDGDFNDRLSAVIDELLDTPEVTEPVRLMKPEAYYQFVDPKLEALTAGQKILVRMGPENAARVKARLREIRGYLQ
jgi:hypothetical protein